MNTPCIRHECYCPELQATINTSNMDVQDCWSAMPTATAKQLSRYSCRQPPQMIDVTTVVITQRSHTSRAQALAVQTKAFPQLIIAALRCSPVPPAEHSLLSMNKAIPTSNKQTDSMHALRACFSARMCAAWRSGDAGIKHTASRPAWAHVEDKHSFIATATPAWLKSCLR